MSQIRISLLSFFLIISSLSSFLKASDNPLYDISLVNAQHARDWASSCAQNMTPEELQVLTNFVYLVYANALIDSNAQTYYAPLLNLSRITRINLDNPHNPNTELSHFAALIENLEQLTEIRLFYTDLLKGYMDFYNQNKIEIVEKALKELQNHASEMLYIWAEENNTQFSDELEKSSRIIAECEKSLHFASDLHKSLHNGILPFVAEEKDKPLAIMNVALQSSAMFMNAADKALDTFNNINDQAMQTICFGTEIYKDHYQELYNILMQDSFDKNYATTLLKRSNILLKDENESLLPETDLVHEHMISIAKQIKDSHQK
jgi:hypothetical protein